MSAVPFHLHSPSRPSPLSQTHSIHPSKLREIQEKKMAYTQTFQLAQRARVKLQQEASRHDHNLRLLVGHANLLDSLMFSLAQAEREQELWFDEVVRENLAEEEDEEEEEGEDVRMSADYELDSSDSDSDESECDSEEEEMEEIEYAVPRLVRKSNHLSLPSLFGAVIGVSEVEEYEDEEEEDEDEHGMYPLHRTAPQHSSPPQLVADLSDDEEEEATPPSPPQISLPFTSPNEKGRIDSSSYFESQPHHPPDDGHEPFFATGGYIHRPAISSF